MRVTGSQLLPPLRTERRHGIFLVTTHAMPSGGETTADVVPLRRSQFADIAQQR